jgi:hypothetical protein
MAIGASFVDIALSVGPISLRINTSVVGAGVVVVVAVGIVVVTSPTGLVVLRRVVVGIGMNGVRWSTIAPVPLLPKTTVVTFVAQGDPRLNATPEGSSRIGLPATVTPVPKRGRDVTEMAWASSLLPFPFSIAIGTRIDVVAVVPVVAVVGGIRTSAVFCNVIGSIDAVAIVGIVVIGIVFALELEDLLISKGERMRYPFFPAFGINGAIVAPPGFRSNSSSITRTLVMLLYVTSYGFGDLFAPHRSPVNALHGNSSYGSIGLHTSGRTERSAIIGSLAVDLDASLLMLPKLREGSSEATHLVVKVGSS